MISRPPRLIPSFLLLAALAHGPASSARAANPPTDSPLPELVLIKPGTRIDAPPFPGWNHLIIKSKSRIDSGDIDTLPSFATDTATLFRSVILADVRPAAGSAAKFRIARVGLGLCVPAEGIDTVITYATLESHPTRLGMVERQVLSAAEEELKKARLVARTPAFALLAAPSDLKIGKTHQKVFLYYLLLLDPETGLLRSYFWSTAAQPRRRTPPPDFTLLPESLVFDCALDVAADRILGTLPINWSFAMNALPSGRRIPLPESVRPWLVNPHKIAADPAAFEAAVRQACLTR